MQVFLTVIYAVLALGSLILLASFRHVPLSELKRRAREGDEHSKSIYRAAVYSEGLGAVFCLAAGVSGSLFFWSLTRSAPGWLAITIGTVFVWTVLVWLPTRWQAGLSVRVAALIAPVLAWLLGYLHSMISPVIGFFARRWPAIRHTGLYDVDDMLDVLMTQHEQADNRIGPRDLSVAMHALTFGKRQVVEIMTPRKDVKSVSADENLGPVLMSELHDSGFSCFPVYDGATEGENYNIIGTLFLDDLVDARAGGQIRDVMHTRTYHVRQNQPLAEVLPELFKPHHHLFVVVDSLDEYVGIVTSKDILRQIVGQPEADESEEQVQTEDDSQYEVQQTYSESIDKV